MIDRQKEIEKLEKKTPHYLASKLYEARERIESMNRTCIDLRYERINDKCFKGLSEVNKNLANLLRENGIFPTKYRLYYIDKSCTKCRWNNDVTGECNYERDYTDVWDDPCKYGEHVFSFPFYSIDASDDGFVGLKGNFELFTISGLELMKVVKEDTNEIIWVHVPEEDDG